MRRLRSEFLFIRPLSDGCVQEQQAAISFSKVKSAQFLFLYLFISSQLFRVFQRAERGVPERR